MRVGLNHYVRKTIKILLWLIAIILLLAGLVFILINLPAVQNLAKNKVVRFLENKIHTPVTIDKFSLDFPKNILLEGIYFEDQAGDTLLAGDTLNVNISLLKLLSNQVMIHEIDLRGIQGYVHRTLQDSTFNFDYIIKAFIKDEKEAQPLNVKAPLRFSVSKINLERIRVKYVDEVFGNDMTAYLHHFDTKIEDFDLDNRKFRIPKIKIAGVIADLKQTKALSQSSVTTDTLDITPGFEYPDIDSDEIEISDIHIKYDNSVTAINSSLDLDSLRITIDLLDLRNQDVNIKQVFLARTSGHFALGKSAQEAVEATATEVATVLEKGWNIRLAELHLDDVDFKYDDITEKKLARGIDYNHIDVKDILTEIKDIIYNADTLYGEVDRLSLTETSGLELKTFQGNFFYGKTSAWLQDYNIETDKTRLSDRIELRYPSLDTLAKDIGVLEISANFENNQLAVQDLFLFAPALAKRDPFRKNPNAIILLDGKIDGSISDLSISDLKISGLGKLQLEASGTIAGLPDVNNSVFNLQVDRFYATSADITGLIPRGSIPSNIRIPEFVSMNGTFNGSLSNFRTNMRLNSSYGAASVNGTLKNITRKGRESYNVDIQTTQFNLGRLIRKEDKIGKVTVTAAIDGIGTDPKTANAKFNGVIREAFYNGYNYHNITVNGTAKNGDIDIEGKVRDQNITLDIDGTANMNGQYPSVHVTLHIDTLNLQKLNFYKKDLRLKGRIVADLETADPDYLNGTINIADAVIVLEGERYKLDTISIVSVATPGDDSLSFRSEFMTADLHGQYNLTQIFPALQGTINKYFNTSLSSTALPPFEPQRIAFNARIIRSPLVEEVLPELKELEDAKLEGNFDSNTGEVKITGNVARMQYSDFTIDNLKLDVHTEADALKYAFTLDQLSNEQFQVLKTSLSGEAKNDILGVNLFVKDVDEKDRYRINSEMKSDADHFDFSLRPDGLLLNYQPWAVSAGNAIHFGGQGLMVENFKISNNNQSLSVQSNPLQPDGPLEVEFIDFKIETLTRLVTKDSLYAGGIIDGTATVRNLKTNPVFTSDLNIEDFSFHGDTVGNISLHVNNETLNTYAAKVGITGRGNDVRIDGFYYDSGVESNYDLDVDIVQLNLASIEGFTGGEINNATGAITGDLKIKGTMAAPSVRGDIHFQQAGFTITRFNSYNRANDEYLRFTSEGVLFDNFTLIDSAGNEAIIDGNIYTTDFRNNRFDLDVQSDNFQVMNSTRENNKLYYGKLFVDMHMHIHGDMGSPVVDGNIHVNKETSFTIVVPQADPGVVEREGIVQFVDMDTMELTILQPAIDSLTKSDLIGMDIAVNISIDKEAEMNLIIDEANGDYLNIKGEANLTGGIDPSGKVTLAGMYEIDQGAYSFSFNQLKREFQIRKGSYISWSGEPLKADVNVTAVYTANTAPLSLVSNQLGDVEQSVINTYKQKLPFEVHLTMRGELLKPVIAFDIELPTKNYGVSTEVIATVQARLAQLRNEPSELNKQVFAVLLLNRFISENPFQNEARGNTISTLARQSASRLLSEQLNNLVGGIIAGFDLTFDINSVEDYTSGELINRTDLTVGLSKQLLDDRLRVTVGSNFELEGPQETDRKATNIAGDISAEYQLSKDGRYLLRAYRKDEYIVVQGQVVETGIGFVFTADYEKLKDLFARQTEEQKFLKKAERLERKEERKEHDHD